MNIALLGFGVVGSGIYEWCRCREDLHVRRVLIRSDKPEIASIATRDFEEILHDDTIDVVAEVMGGLHPAYEYVTQAMKSGKNVVTANKHLVAHYYCELTQLAREQGVAFRCTPAVGGGIPWLVNLERVLRLDEVTAFSGIMNGTTNFILDAMHTDGSDFAEVLKLAQELGYAEADPSADIDGLDIQRKCIITANVAFGCCLSEEDVPVFGIRTVTAADIKAAESMNGVCKMLAFGSNAGGKLSVYVEPSFVPVGELEAAVSTNRNVISFETALTGKESFCGQGAGRFPTAYNAVADCLDIASGVHGFYTDTMKPAKPDNSAEKHPYYVRFEGRDAWLDSVTIAPCGDGVITGDLPVSEMHAWAARAKAADPALFIAGII